MIDGLYAFLAKDDENLTLEFVDGNDTATLFSISNNTLVATTSQLIANVDTSATFQDLFFNSADYLAYNSAAGATCSIDDDTDVLSCDGGGPATSLVWCDSQGTIALSQGVPSSCAAAAMYAVYA
ncbi:hypothetical protein MBLNU459_g4466t2 [Dothideomycetes sp. NU459]